MGIGHAARTKGHRELMMAPERMLWVAAENRLVLAGDGPCRTELEREVRDLKGNIYLNFLGQREGIRGIMSACHVVAPTSAAIESLPLLSA